MDAKQVVAHTGSVLAGSSSQKSYHINKMVMTVGTSCGSSRWKLLRCCAHSVRPVTHTERAMHEIESREDTSKWRTLADVLPDRTYTDIVDEEPAPEDREVPDLSPAPDKTTKIQLRKHILKGVPRKPARRVHFKQTVTSFADDNPGDLDTGQHDADITPGASSSNPSAMHPALP